MPAHYTIDGVTYSFRDLKDLLAKATPARAGDELAGIAAGSSVERVAAQMALADLPFIAFLKDAVVFMRSTRLLGLSLIRTTCPRLLRSPALRLAGSGIGCSPTTRRLNRSLRSLLG